MSMKETVRCESYMIETKALTKIFSIQKAEDIQAVMDLTLSIPEGEVFGFLGQMGLGRPPPSAC
jgi:ABC-type oligopeptide transport system ATPase subunit